MAVELNHHVVNVTDPVASARWLAELLGVDEPHTFGPFEVVELANGVSLDFMALGDQPFQSNHYAFLVSEDEFDEIFGRITAAGYDYFADPAGQRKGEINHHWGGRGVYWPDPDGHWLEIITRPYGSS